MIAGCHQIDSGCEQLVRNRRSDGKPAGHVFRVQRRDVDRVLLFNVLQAFKHGHPAGFSHNVTDDQ